MDNSRPPAWALVKGPDGKLFSHLEWPKVSGFVGGAYLYSDSPETPCMVFSRG